MRVLYLPGNEIALTSSMSEPETQTAGRTFSSSI